MARGDVFENKFIATILRFLKIMPVYRIRDGKEKMKLNEVIFHKAVEVMHNKKILTVFPEATHNDKRFLRILKKGISRIAFHAINTSENELGLKIVPIGLYYSNFENAGSKLLVNYGKAFSLDEFAEQRKENEQKAMIALRNKISAEISSLMINISSKEYYDVYEILREVFRSKMLNNLELNKRKLSNQFRADKKTIATVEYLEKENPQDMDNLATEARKYQKMMENLRIKNWVVERDYKKNTPVFWRLLLLFFLSPIFLIGWVSNIIPVTIIMLPIKKIRDKMFHSSVKFALGGIILFPLWNILLSLAIAIFTNCPLLGILHLILSPIIGTVTLRIQTLYVKTFAMLRFRSNKKQADEICKKHDEIVSTIENIYTLKSKTKNS